MSITALATCGGTSSSFTGTRFSSAWRTPIVLPSRARTTERADKGRSDFARSSFWPFPAVKNACASGTRRIAARAIPTPAMTIATAKRTHVLTTDEAIGRTHLRWWRGGKVCTLREGAQNLVRHWRGGEGCGGWGGAPRAGRGGGGARAAPPAPSRRADARLVPPQMADAPDVDVPARRAMARRARMLAFVNLAVDLVAITCGYLLSKGIIVSTRADAASRSPFTLSGRWVLLTIPLWLVIFAAYGLYDRRELDAPSEEIRRLFHGITVSIVVIVMVTFFARFAVSRGWIASLALFCTLTVAVGRFAVRKLTGRLSASGYLCTTALIVGTNEEARTIARSLHRHRKLGYSAVGFVSVSPVATGSVDGLPVVGTVDDIAAV